MSDIATLFGLFRGQWQLTRTSVGLSSNNLLAKADGHAEFATAGTPLSFLYKETGKMRPTEAQAPLDFFRHYTYALIGEEIHVLYGDGPQTGQLYQRLIFDAAKNQLVSREEHLCAADRYTSRYAFANDNQFTLETTVRGPRKDYVIRTEFNRTNP